MALSAELHRKIIRRMEEGKIPIYPELIRRKSITRYKAEKQAELRRRQAVARAKIAAERRARAKRESEERSAIYEARETQRKKAEARAEALKDVRTGSWVKIAPDGSVSSAGEAAYSPSEAKAMGFKWGTTVRKNGKAVFVPLPKKPTEAQYHGILQEKVARGHYAHRPKVEKRIKKKIAMGGKEYGITAPAWAAGYMKEYQAKAHAITQAYRKAARSTKTPSGYELKGITLAKEDKGLRFEYVGKKPVPVKASVAPAPPKHKPTPKPTVRGVQGVGGYGTDFAVAESIPMGEPTKVRKAPAKQLEEGFEGLLGRGISGYGRLLASVTDIPSTVAGKLTAIPGAIKSTIIDKGKETTAAGLRKLEDAIPKLTEEDIKNIEAYEKPKTKYKAPFAGFGEITLKEGEAPGITIAKNYEELYHKHIVDPISTWIGGEQARKKKAHVKSVERERADVDTLEKRYLSKGLIKGGTFVGSEAEFDRYTKELNEYESALSKLAEINNPTRKRQLVRGAVEIISILPTVPLFFGRIAAETLTKPTNAPSKAVTFGKGFIKFAKEEPWRVGAQLAAMAAIPFAKKVPVRPGISVSRLSGGSDAISLGLKTQRGPKGVYGEYYPAITFAKKCSGLKRVSVGKPKIKGEVFSEKPIVPAEPFSTRIAVEAIPEEAVKITAARGVRKYTIRSGVKPKELKPIIKETLDHHGLVKSTEVVTKLLKTEKADLYGSVSQKAAGRAVGREALSRTPRDFDVKVTNPKTFAERAVRRINKAEGREVVKIKGGEVVVKKTGAKLFDVHSKTDVGEYVGGEGYLAYGLREEPLIKTREGIRTTTLSEQSTRKLHGGMTITGGVRVFKGKGDMPTVRGKIAPAHEGRVKDIADYYFAEKANIAGLKHKGRVISAKKANIHLEKWLETWGKEVKKYIKDLYAKTVKSEGGEKAWLGTFEERPYSPSRSYKLVSQEVSYVPTVAAATSAISTIPADSSVSRLMSNIHSKVSGISEVSISGISEVSSLGGLSKVPSKKDSEISKTSRYIISKVPKSDTSKQESARISDITSIYNGIGKSNVPPSKRPPSLPPTYKYEYPYLDKRLPSEVPYSKLSKVPSYIPPSGIPPSYIPPSRIPKQPPKKKKKKAKKKAKKQWEWLEEFTVQLPHELHFGAIESGIPKVSKAVMLPQVSMEGIVKAIKPKTKKTPKKRTTKTKKKNKRARKNK